MLRFIFVFIAMFIATLPAAGATFKAKRGISLDIWVAWPNEDQWADPNVILPFPEWQKSVGKLELQALKDNGFDFVRMPIDPAVLLSSKTTSLRDQLYANIADAISLVERSGLKLIVDIHALPAGGGRAIGTKEILTDPSIFEAYLDAVRQIGAIVKTHDAQTVALELFNEPTIDCEDDNTNNWPGLMKKAFAAARASTTRTTLILSGACWGSAEGLARINPADYPDDNLIWSFHSYEPFLFSHQGATWAGDFAPHVYGLPFPLHEATQMERETAYDAIRARINADAPFLRRSGLLAYFDEQVASVNTQDELNAAMAKPFKTVEAWVKKHGIDPSNIILGEFGIIHSEYNNPVTTAGKVRAAFYKKQLELAEERGFAWSMWSYGGAFGIVDAFEGKRAGSDVLEMVRALPSR